MGIYLKIDAIILGGIVNIRSLKNKSKSSQEAKMQISKDANKEKSYGFFSMMMFIVKDVMLHPLHFFLQPIERDVGAKIKEKEIMKIPRKRYALDHGEGLFTFFMEPGPEVDSVEVVEILALKIETYRGEIECICSAHYDDKVSVGDSCEVRFQESRRNNSFLKGRELIHGDMTISLSPLNN